jgi:hypothetical protein
MNLSAIQAAIFQWVTSELSGETVVWADQAAPRPARPFVTLKLRGPFRDLGGDEIRHTGTEGAFEIVGHRRFTVSVQTVGGNVAVAQQLAIDLNTSLGKPSVLAALRAANISVSDEGDVQNLTAFLDTQFEARFAFDVSILVVSSSGDNLGSIRTTEITSFGDTETVGE